MAKQEGKGLTKAIQMVDDSPFVEIPKTWESDFEKRYNTTLDDILTIYKIENSKALSLIPEGGVVIYCDGGARPSRGRGGYGLHGYFYTKETPKQGSGAKATPTAKGYVDGPDGKKQAVTVLGYFDFIVPMDGIITNNRAELNALIESHHLINFFGVGNAHILTDSEYCRNGLEKWVHAWQKNDWKKRDGNPVENREDWESLLDIQSKTKAMDSDVTIVHVKGHNGEIGNTAADNLASRAVLLAHENDTQRRVTFSYPKGYWNLGSGVKVNRMFSKSQLYFNTHIDVPKSKDGRFIYYLGKHGPDDSLFGKPMPEASFSVIYVKDEEPIVVAIKAKQNAITPNNEIRVIVARMSTLFNPRYYRDIQDNGGVYVVPKPKTQNLRMIDKIEVTYECMPPALSYHGVNTIGTLEDNLQRYLDGSKEITVTDITDQLFDLTEKKGKVICKLNNEITVSTRYIDSLVSYNTHQHAGAMKVRLVMDMDLPSRNVLSALADLKPTVKVITWPESDSSYRVATIVEAGEDVGIYAAMYSNLKFINSK